MVSANKIRNVLLDALCLIIIAEIVSVLASSSFSWEVTVVTLVAVVLFLIFALMAKRGPYPAIISALVVFIILSILSAALKPTYLGGSIIVKIFILIYLVRAIPEARELQSNIKNKTPH